MRMKKRPLKLKNIALWGLSSLVLALIMALTWHSGVLHGIHKAQPIDTANFPPLPHPSACGEDHFDDHNEEDTPSLHGRFIHVQHQYQNQFDIDLHAFRAQAQAQRGKFQDFPTSWPVHHGYLSSFFGKRSKKRQHAGIDIVAPRNDPVFAIADGVVERVGSQRGYGKYIDIRHDDGMLSRYAHNSQNLVKKGQNIVRGDKIARVGSSGNASTPHVHFELHYNGKAIDPLPYLFTTLSRLDPELDPNPNPDTHID
jgi:murein DD-endopeptidase MepM/ murein hydrolase activator NlpD